MRVYGVESGGKFTEYKDGKLAEYKAVPFQEHYTEKKLEKWLKKNPDSILEGEQLLLVRRQAPTNLGGAVDLLGVDRNGRTVVVELKSGRAERTSLAQALEYAASAAHLDADAIESLFPDHKRDGSASLVERHRAHFGLESDVVEFNKDQRIVIVAEQITPAIRQTASFLESRGVLITCVEFSFFKNERGPRLLALTQEEVVGRRDSLARTTPTTPTKKKFLKTSSKHGRKVYGELLEWFGRKKGFVTKVSKRGKSFTVRVRKGERRIVVCYCYHRRSDLGQALYTGFSEQKPILKKDLIERLRRSAECTGLFKPPKKKGGTELRIPIDKSFTRKKRDRLLEWFESVQKIIEDSRSVT